MGLLMTIMVQVAFCESEGQLVGAEGVCQAGQMRGLEDDRSGRIRQVFRLIDDLPKLNRCCMYS